MNKHHIECHLCVITLFTPFNYDFQDFIYKTTTDVTNKTKYVVNKGFALLGADL